MRRALLRTLVAIGLFLGAGALGYALAAGAGQEIVRLEAERQLSRLLRGEVEVGRARLVIADGLRLEGEDVRAYPGSRGAGLSAQRVSAGVDVLSLLAGRFRLHWLLLSGARMNIQRHADGSWSPYPVARLAKRDAAARPGHEAWLEVARGAEAVARVLLEKPIVAGLVELRDSEVHFVDERAHGEGKSPLSLRLEGIEGSLRHRWLAGDAELALRAIWVDEAATRVSMEASGSKSRDTSLHLEVAATGLALESLEPYLRKLQAGSSVSGMLSGVIGFTSPAKEHGVFEIDWLARDLGLALPLRAEGIRIDTERVAANARIEISPRRVWLERAELGDGGVLLDLSGILERPLRGESRARLAADLSGATLAEVRRFVAWLPKADRTSLQRLMERIESGRISRFGGSGTASIDLWQRLFANELSELPIGFVIGAELAGVTFTAGEADRITDVAAEVEWSGDRMEIREASARWNDALLPRLDLVLEGASHLFEAPEMERVLTAEASPIPALGLLDDLLRENLAGDAEARELPPIDIEIEELDHPALRWPLERAQLSVSAREGGLAIDLHRGTWAGAPVHALIHWFDAPEARLRVHLDVGAAGALDEQARAATLASSVALPVEVGAEEAPQIWAAGRFGVGPLEQGVLPFQVTKGAFWIDGSTLHLADTRCELLPKGALEGRAEFDLGRPDEVGLILAFQLEGADLSQLTALFGLPPKLASGDVSLQAKGRAALRPGVAPLLALEGQLRGEARDGELLMETPLLVALAHASEGFNPFAARHSVHYDRISATLDFDEGTISTDDLEMTGPMQVFASGDIELHEPAAIEAVVGIFLFRQPGSLPLVKYFIPGGERGLVGAYFDVRGLLEEPEVDTLTMSSLAGVLPDIVKAPFKMIQLIQQSIADSGEQTGGAKGRFRRGYGARR